MKLALIAALTLITTAAVAQQSSAPPTSSAQVAPHKWDVMQVRCSDLLGAASPPQAFW